MIISATLSVLLVLSIMIACSAAGFYAVQNLEVQDLLPGDPAITGAALDHMMESWRSGVPVTEAFTEFCQEIVDHAQIV